MGSQPEGLSSEPQRCDTSQAAPSCRVTSPRTSSAQPHCLVATRRDWRTHHRTGNCRLLDPGPECRSHPPEAPGALVNQREHKVPTPAPRGARTARRERFEANGQRVETLQAMRGQSSARWKHLLVSSMPQKTSAIELDVSELRLSELGGCSNASLEVLVLLGGGDRQERHQLGHVPAHLDATLHHC
jgi:hypothetical protein